MGYICMILYRSSRYVLVEFSGIERGIVKIADDEVDGVGSSSPETVASSHEVMDKCHLSVSLSLSIY
jgi:hypothetical protein